MLQCNSWYLFVFHTLPIGFFIQCFYVNLLNQFYDLIIVIGASSYYSLDSACSPLGPLISRALAQAQARVT